MTRQSSDDYDEAIEIETPEGRYVRWRLAGRVAAVAAGSAIALIGIPHAGAARQQAKASVSAVSWYWEDASSQTFDTPQGKVIVGTPNPFCPEAPGSLGSIEDTCAPERLPVWVREGDYETPYMISAIAFDLFSVPTGSTVHKFTVTFLEDEAACEEEQGTNTGQRCRNTRPIGVEGEGRKLRACRIGATFGGGEARPYNEVPDHVCARGDPTATRKRVKAVHKSDEDGEDHVWTFDLTSFARQWTREFTLDTGVLITAQPPRDQPDQTDNWRVVLAGPDVTKAIRTKIVFTPPKNPPPPPPPRGTNPGGVSTGGGLGDTASSSTTTITNDGFGAPTTGTGSAPIGETAFPGATAPSGAIAPQPAPSPSPASATGEVPEPVELPGYMWLALLAGLVGLSLVKRVVLESATGIRPEGPLAQIHKLNAARKGATPQEVGEAGAPTLAKLAAALKDTVSGAVGRAKPLLRRG